jgi:hypothetical protein
MQRQCQAGLMRLREPPSSEAHELPRSRPERAPYQVDARWRIATVPNVYSFRPSHSVGHDLVTRGVLRVLLQQCTHCVFLLRKPSGVPEYLHAAGTRRGIHCGLRRLPSMEQNRRTVLPAACHRTLPVSARWFWSPG